MLSPKEVVRQWVDAFNAGDVERSIRPARMWIFSYCR